MKLMRKLTTITLLAILSFIGVGFAAWTFTAERSTEVTGITDKVAVGIELTDDFELYNASDDSLITALYLICDAPSSTTAGILGTGNGVYWATDADGENAVTSVYLKGTITKNDEDGVWDNKATVTVSFTATHDLAENSYVSFGSFASIANTTGVSTDDGTDVQSANFNLPTVSYKSVPTSVEALSAMNTALGTALSGKKLTIKAQITA